MNSLIAPELKYDPDLQYRLLLQAEQLANVGHWLLEIDLDDPSGNIVYWSDEIFRIHGLDPDVDDCPQYDEAINFYHPDDREKVIHYVTRAVNNNESFQFELRLIQPSGDQRIVQSYGRPNFDSSNGKVISLFGVFQDITVFRNSQDELLKNEERLRQVINSVNDGYWDWYIQDNYEYMSPRFWEILGYDYREKKHDPAEWQSLIFKEDLEKAIKNLEMHIESRGLHPYHQEARFYHKDGSIVNVICRGHVIEWADDGKPIRMIGTHTDITKLRNSEQNLKDSEQNLKDSEQNLKDSEQNLKDSENRFSLAVSGASVGIWDWIDVNKDEEWWSSIFYELLGYASHELLPSVSNFKTILHPDDHKRTFDMVENHFKTREPFRIEYRLKHKDRGYLWFLGTGQAVWNKAGQPVRMIGSIMDINEQKRLQNLDNKHRDELSEKLKERTSELKLVQKDLIKQEKLATLGHVTAAVGHELRNPLGSIRNSIFTIKKQIDEDYVTNNIIQDAVGRIERSIQRCDKIVDELLIYTKEQEVLELSKMKIFDFIEQCVHEIECPKTINIINNCSKDTTVRIDRYRMERVFFNLLQNSIKAIMDPEEGQRSGMIRISDKKTETSYEIVLYDNGPGIPEHLVKTVMEPLVSTRSFGIGLGLSIVKRIIDRHQGKIDIMSVYGEYTQVVLTFPRSIID